jgi:hypothetical protein
MMAENSEKLTAPELLAKLVEFQRRAKAWLDAVDTLTVQQHAERPELFRDFNDALKWFAAMPDDVLHDAFPV